MIGSLKAFMIDFVTEIMNIYFLIKLPYWRKTINIDNSTTLISI